MCKSSKTTSQTTQIQYTQRQYRYRHPVNIIPLRSINTNGDLETNARRFRITFRTYKNSTRAFRIYNHKGRADRSSSRKSEFRANQFEFNSARDRSRDAMGGILAHRKQKGGCSFLYFFRHLSTFPAQNEL